MSVRRATVVSRNGMRAAVSALLVVAVAVIMLVLVRARPEAEPFDPRSSAAQGTRGLALLLAQQGAAVDIVRNVPQPGSPTRTLVLQDRLNEEQRRDLIAFVEAGGVVVMADPESTVFGDRFVVETVAGSVPSSSDNDVLSHANILVGDCDVPALEHLRGLFVVSGSRFQRSAPSRSCFGDGQGVFVIAADRGAGLIVQLGDNELFTNRLLRYADNGPLATALLAPTSNASVSILLGAEQPKSVADIGTGEKTLSDLLRPGVWMALAQLAFAFVVFATAKAVRTGRPVREPEQVPIAGSALVVATGSLMRRARHARRAGWMLRGNLYRELCQRFHLPPTASIATVDETVAANTTFPPGHVAALLTREVDDDAGLLNLSRSLQHIRETVNVREGADLV